MKKKGKKRKKVKKNRKMTLTKNISATVYYILGIILVTMLILTLFGLQIWQIW